MRGGESAGPASNDGQADRDNPDTAPIPLPPSSPFAPFPWAATPSTPHAQRPWAAEEGPDHTSHGRTPQQRLDLPAHHGPFAHGRRAGVAASPFVPHAPRGRRWRRMLAVAAAVLVAAATAVLVVSQWDSDGETTASTPTEQHERDGAAEANLRALLPPGYPPGACTAVDPTNDATATVQCTANNSPGAPQSATFSLLSSPAALRAAFSDTATGNSVVVCPGNIQSPGPWRRNSAPQQPAGDLMCALDATGNPLMAWSSTRDLLLAEIHGEQPTVPLTALYAWWTTHS